VSSITDKTEAKELGVQENDIVDAVIVQVKPPPSAPVWQTLSQGLQSLEKTLEKTNGEDVWGSDGVVSQEIIQHQHKEIWLANTGARWDGVAWNVDPSFMVPPATPEERQSMKISNLDEEKYFEVSHYKHSSMQYINIQTLNSLP
jgi:hypothetical protein